jgi:hypothetical protein
MNPNPAVPRLWHVSQVPLGVGAIVPPGRFGQAVIAGGAYASSLPGVSYFFREYMLEFVRVSRTSAVVSRLNCAFAFESQRMANILATQTQKPYYEVTPADPRAPISQHDMGWIDWMSQPRTTPSDVVHAIERYWNGDVAPKMDLSGWEWLSSSGLRILG